MSAEMERNGWGDWSVLQPSTSHRYLASSTMIGVPGSSMSISNTRLRYALARTRSHAHTGSGAPRLLYSGERAAPAPAHRTAALPQSKTQVEDAESGICKQSANSLLTPRARPARVAEERSAETAEMSHRPKRSLPRSM